MDCDHSVLIIENCLTRWQSQSDVNIGYNYDSGNYDDFCSFLTCDWDSEFKAANSQVDEIWEILQSKLVKGTETFIPLVKQFNCLLYTSDAADE